MNQQMWEELSRRMAIEAIVSELADMMVPVNEGRPRAERCIAAGQQDARLMEHHMGLALMALEKLGYTISRRPD